MEKCVRGFMVRRMGGWDRQREKGPGNEKRGRKERKKEISMSTRDQNWPMR